MMKMTLPDGTELTGFIQNGSNYVFKEKVDESLFSGILDSLTVTDDETGEETVYNKAQFVQQQEHNGEYYICFRELTQQELKDIETQAKLEYIALMADVDLEDMEV